MTGHDEHENEYDDNFVHTLELVWGEGFLSPGGADEVAKGYVDSVTGTFTGRVLRVWGGLETEPLP